MLSRNLRGEMIADLQGAKLSLTDSRFIQVIAKSLSISCKEVDFRTIYLTVHFNKLGWVDLIFIPELCRNNWLNFVPSMASDGAAEKFQTLLSVNAILL